MAGNGDSGNIYQQSLAKTEKGYSLRLARNITKWESVHRKYSDESLAAFSTDGKLVSEIQGAGARVIVTNDKKKSLENKILTHNHPRALGRKGIGAIGSSFSVHDIALAVEVNAKEIRAVTPTYTFSLKRKGKEWGISPKEYNICG